MTDGKVNVDENEAAEVAVTVYCTNVILNHQKLLFITLRY